MSPNLCQYIVGTHRREEELILPVSWWPTNDMFCSFCKKKKKKRKRKGPNFTNQPTMEQDVLVLDQSTAWSFVRLLTVYNSGYPIGDPDLNK